MIKIKPLNEIILSKEEVRLLRSIEGTVVALDDPKTKTASFKTLLDYKMVVLTVSDKFPIKNRWDGNPIPNAYTVDKEVSRYWLFQKKQSSLSRKESLRYWITTTIAIIALILAALSLAWQVYAWSEERKDDAELTESKNTIVATEEDKCFFIQKLQNF